MTVLGSTYTWVNVVQSTLVNSAAGPGVVWASATPSNSLYVHNSILWFNAGSDDVSSGASRFVRFNLLSKVTNSPQIVDVFNNCKKPSCNTVGTTAADFYTSAFFVREYLPSQANDFHLHQPNVAGKPRSAWPTPAILDLPSAPFSYVSFMDLEGRNVDPAYAAGAYAYNPCKNGNNCGTGCATRCSVGKYCTQSSDCSSDTCTANVCN